MRMSYFSWTTVKAKELVVGQRITIGGFLYEIVGHSTNSNGTTHLLTVMVINPAGVNPLEILPTQDLDIMCNSENIFKVAFLVDEVI